MSFYEFKKTMFHKMRIFIDMDGTIVVWNTGAHIDEITTKGYFANLPPIASALEAVKLLIKHSDLYNVEVYILSSVFLDNHSINDKMTWLKKYLPEIDTSHYIFVPYGESKQEYIKKILINTYSDDTLVDDYSPNLLSWNGIGIKMLNGINGNNGTWTGYCVKNNMRPEDLMNQIIAICYFEKTKNKE